MVLFLQLLLFTAFPIAVGVAGSWIATKRAPTPRQGSYIQHFAAGVVFAAVALEVLPDVVHNRAPIAAVIGFSLGVALMLLIRSLTARGGAEGEGKNARGLVTTVGVDIFIDGLLLGIGFSLGVAQGALLAVALAAELLSLGLSVTTALVSSGTTKRRAFTLSTLIFSLFAVGSLGGYTLLSGLTGAALEVLLSFAAAALLYLVTEELLTEAHEVPETPFTTAMFFVGFLFIMVIDMLA